MNQFSVVGFTIVVAAATAAAQTQTPEEAAFVRHLGSSLGRSDLSTDVPQLGRGYEAVSAISVRAGQDLRFDRIQFASADEAQHYAQFKFTDAFQNGASWKRQRINPNLTGEVRGDQVLLVYGDAVADPKRASELRALAWKGLPGSGPAEGAFAIDMRDGSGAITTRLAKGPLRDQVNGILESLRQRGASGDAKRYQEHADGAELLSQEGVLGGARVSDAASSFWVTRDEGRRSRMLEWLAALNAGMNPEAAERLREPQGGAVKGATQRLGNLLGGG